MTRMNRAGHPAVAGSFPATGCHAAGEAARRRAMMLSALIVAAPPLLAPAARAAGTSLQFATSGIELPVRAPVEDSAATPLGTTAPLYERAPMPNQDALVPEHDTGGSSDPVQPSVIRRASRVGESDGYSRNSSSTSAQESRMKPGLGFALHVPTE